MANFLKKLEGKKTWIGIIITIVGFTGASDLITPEQIQESIELVLKFVGICLTVYGNYQSHKRIRELKA